MILPKNTDLLSIYNTLESVERLITRDDIILKSLILTKDDYTLSGVRFKFNELPGVVDIKYAEAVVNLVKIRIPIDLNVLCVYDNKFFWKSALNLSEGDYVFGISNSVVHSFPIQEIKFVTTTGTQVELTSFDENSPIVFIGSYLVNVSQRYMAIAVR